MCCCLSGEPVEDTTGRYKTHQGSNTFQTGMCGAPCASCPKSCCWFLGQFIPCTAGCTQCCLRKKVLHNDMTKYSCFQGYGGFCCIQAGTCGEQNCPDFCLCLESFCCNCIAVSASRMYVMEKYDLSSEPCDYRLIRFNNCLQLLACICSILAIFFDGLRELARIINCIADLVYACISGCMTAQVAHEQNYQDSLGNAEGGAYPVVSAQPVDKQFEY